MAIAVDATSFVAIPTASSTTTYAHTCAGSDRYLLAAYCFGAAESATDVPTYNGVSMTLVKDSTISPNSTSRVLVYGLVAPATGANDLVWARSTSSDGRTGLIIRSFTGVDQSTPIGTAVSAVGSSATATVNVSSAADELVADFVHNRDIGGGLTVGAGQTQRVNSLSESSYAMFGASDETGAGTTTMSWAIGDAYDWAIAAVPLKPVSGGGGSTGPLVGGSLVNGTLRGLLAR